MLCSLRIQGSCDLSFFVFSDTRPTAGCCRMYVYSVLCTMVLLQDLTGWASDQIGVKDSMFFEEGKAWGRSRRLISPNLNGHNVAAMLPVMSKV